MYIYIHILYILYTILYCSNNSNIITQSFEKITLPIRIHLNQFKLIPPLGKIQVCVCASLIDFTTTQKEKLGHAAENGLAVWNCFLTHNSYKCAPSWFCELMLYSICHVRL